MSIIVYQDVATPIVPVEGIAGRIREALGSSLRQMRYITPDFAGLYQDAVGTTPVTAVGQPVGLMLDRRFGLEMGPELGTAQAALSDLTVSGEVDVTDLGDRFRITRNSAPYVNSRQLIFDTAEVGAGKTYEAKFKILNVGSSNNALNAVTNGGTTEFVFAAYSLGNTTRRGINVATGAGNRRLRFTVAVSRSSNPSSAVEGDWVEVSKTFFVREVPGNRASQPTTTARPAMRSGPLRIDYDGVDDYLRTVFPALGSSVTIARSIPGTGAQILTGQTIAAGNWDDNVDSCATLVIDRALTGPETALVTAFLNQQAGV